jgi:Na+-driven multidrug efflux pump
MQIASLLFVIPNATNSSLFAEGSNNEKGLKKSVYKSIWIISLLLIPAILITFIFGHFILSAFGSEYSSQGINLLKIMALSGIFVSVNSIFGSVFKVRKRIKEIIVRTAIGTVVIIGLSYFFIYKGIGIVGVGYAYLIGQAVMAGIYWAMYKIKKKRE